jgi:hypothetical protein
VVVEAHVVAQPAPDVRDVGVELERVPVLRQQTAPARQALDLRRTVLVIAVRSNFDGGGLGQMLGMFGDGRALSTEACAPEACLKPRRFSGTSYAALILR